jgi:hypothetical protein
MGSTPLVQTLEIVWGVTNFLHNLGTMMQSLLVGAVFVAMVMTPCVVALVTATHKSDNASESNVLEEGFI